VEVKILGNVEEEREEEEEENLVSICKPGQKPLKRPKVEKT